MKKLPRISIVGKPNVGKSTLINRLCSNTEAIVHSEPMITRDRKQYKTDWAGISFYLIDTGGIDLKNEQKLSKQIYNQSIKAIEQSDIVLFVVDLKSPISALDEEIADILRKSAKPVIFAGNKWDDSRSEYFTEDYLSLGYGYPITVSAIHGLNIYELLDSIIENIKKLSTMEEYTGFSQLDQEELRIPSISILGRPNVGKSTLFNKIIREERVIVDDIEGTTRDSIDSIVTINKKHYRFIDTAGLKKDKIREENLEFYSKLRTLKSIEKSDICLVLIDSKNGITIQDHKIIATCVEKGASVCVLFNKTDLLDSDELEKLIELFNMDFEYIKYIPFLKISALISINLNKIIALVDRILEERGKKIPDNKIMELFKKIETKDAIYLKGKKFKIKFIKQFKQSPPGFIVFSNMDISRKTNIKRYIESNIRKNFGFIATPIFFKYKY